MTRPFQHDSLIAAQGGDTGGIDRRRLVTGAAVAAALAALGAGRARAQGAYPSRPITMVVPFTAGSSTDEIARVLGQALQAEFNIATVIDNKPGAEGAIAAIQVARAAPDGYTVLVGTNSTHAAAEHLKKKLDFDPVADYTPVAALCKSFQIAMVPADSPYRTVTQFVEAARAKPGTLSFGASSTSTRVAGELMKQMSNTNVTFIPYKGNAQGLSDLYGGRLDMMITDSSTALAQAKSGKVRALAVTGSKRLPVAPDVSTFDESLKGFESSGWTAIYLPKNASPEITNALAQILARASRHTLMTTLMANTGKETFYLGPAELKAFQAAESAKWGRIVKAAGIQPE